MPYAIGPYHNVIGSGELAAANLVGLQVVVTSVPASASVRVGSPPLYHGLGHVSFGDSNGFQRPETIRHVAQVIYPLPDGISRIGYTLEPGVAATLTLLTGQLVDRRLLRPWDRNPATWSRRAVADLAGGTGEVMAFTYTVPAGRMLLLSHADVRLTRLTAPSATPNPTYAVLYRSATAILHARLHLSAAGFMVNDQLAGPLVLLQTEPLTAYYGNYDTGGSVSAQVEATGILFDV
jgi:hypothetical protein